jgi:hypothetical protein
MSNELIEITLFKDKIREIVKAWYVIGDFLDTFLPKEMLYKEAFLQGLEEALQEVQSGQAKPNQCFP